MRREMRDEKKKKEGELFSPYSEARVGAIGLITGSSGTIGAVIGEGVKYFKTTGVGCCER